MCLLGGGAIIGDMSVRESGGAPPRRSATVVALTELVTYKVPLKEFKRRMPADVLEVRTGKGCHTQGVSGSWWQALWQIVFAARCLSQIWNLRFVLANQGAH